MIKKQYPLDIQSYNFKISTPVQLRFNDLDGYGHANNSSMQAFFDLGRAAYLQEACGSDFYKSNKTLLVVSYSTDFYRQVHLEDHVEVRVAVYRIGNKSISMLMTIVNLDNGEICAVSDSVMSGFDKETQGSCSILPQWRSKMEQIEGRRL